MKEYLSKFLIILLAGFVSCSSNPGINNLPETADIALPPQATVAIQGYAGLGPLANSNISAIDVTDFKNPIVLGTTSSDQNGLFEITLTGIDNTQRVEFVATSGTYVDPITLEAATISQDPLRAVYPLNILNENQNSPNFVISITPFSSLFTSFFECIQNNYPLKGDPYLYAQQVFLQTFGIDLSQVQYGELNSTTNQSSTNTLYDFYNLAFSKMAQMTNAISAADIFYVYDSEIKSQCILLLSADKNSGQFVFDPDSFRTDYLNALLAFNNDPNYQNFASNIDLSTTVDSIRENPSFLF